MPTALTGGLPPLNKRFTLPHFTPGLVTLNRRFNDEATLITVITLPYQRDNPTC